MKKSHLIPSHNSREFKYVVNSCIVLGFGWTLIWPCRIPTLRCLGFSHSGLDESRALSAKFVLDLPV